MSSQRAAYIEKMQLQVDELNKKMLGLETTAQEEKEEVREKHKEEKEEAREKHKEEMSKLRQQSEVAAAKLEELKVAGVDEELKVAGVDSWDTLVADMEKIHDAFTHSFFSLFQVHDFSESAAKSEKTESSTAHKKA